MTRNFVIILWSTLALLLSSSSVAARAPLQKPRTPIVGPAQSNEPQIWITTGLFQQWDRAPTNPPAWWARRTDAWEMFTQDGTKQWQHVLDRVSVIALTPNSVQTACIENRTKLSANDCSDMGMDPTRSLDQFFRFLKAHHIHPALEVGLLVDTQLVPSSTVERECGSEAFISEASLRGIFQKIREAGGSLDYIRMDEPFWYGTASCHDTVKQVAKNISLAIGNVVKPYFPDVQIGDVEPVISSPNYPALLGQWVDTYLTVTGGRLAFFQTDPDWGGDLIFRNLAAIERVMGDRSVPFGIMYTANNDTSDLGWTRSAIRHFTMAESYFHIHVAQASFQSWTRYPTFMLPEQKPGTLLNVARQYLLPKTYLSMIKTDGAHGPVRVKLTDAERAPLAGANVKIEAVDVQKTWPLTNRTMQGVVPTNGAYGVVGVRANIEGSRMSAEQGEADVGPISVTSNGKAWHSNYQIPLKMHLSPTKTLLINLSLPGATVCNGISSIPLDAGASYTLSVPMSATSSADHAGYVTIVFLDRACKGIKRSDLYFSPSSEWLTTTTVATNSEGELLFTPPTNIDASGAELQAYYDGDDRYHRPSVSILDLKGREPTVPSRPDQK